MYLSQLYLNICNFYVYLQFVEYGNYKGAGLAQAV
jgi:hypothetical protein